MATKQGFLQDPISGDKFLPESQGGGVQYDDAPSTPRKTFSVKVNTRLAQLDTDSQVGDSYIEGTDYGWISFPDTYTPDGTPTRLVISCHGSSRAKNGYTDDTVAKATFTSILNAYGYAVMDMFGLPYEVSGIVGGTTPDNSELHFGMPVTLLCYKAGYDYVMRHFNLKRDGIYISTSSMGGLIAMQIAQSGLFPVLAQAMWCPCLDLYKQAWCNPWYNGTFQRAKIAQYYGFTGTAPTYTNNKPPTDSEKQYFIDNIDKVIGYNPIMRNVTSGDIKSILNEIPNPLAVNNYPAAEKALYDALTAWHPCPVKIWHNTVDSTMPFRYSRYWVDMVRRSGGMAYLRPFTSAGTDGVHDAWSNGANVTITAPNGSSFTIRASYYEALEWIRRFG